MGLCVMNCSGYGLWGSNTSDVVGPEKNLEAYANIVGDGKKQGRGGSMMWLSCLVLGVAFVGFGQTEVNHRQSSRLIIDIPFCSRHYAAMSILFLLIR